MIDANQYLLRLMSVIEQFKLAKRMVSTFSASSGDLAAIVNEESLALQNQFDRLSVPNVSEEIAQRREHLVQKYSQQLQAELPNRIAHVGNRLNQNELILLVALFEAQMKDIQREILRQEPALLKPDRMIPLGRIVAVGRDAIVEEEIEREVQEVDRKSVADRAQYFERRLRIDWFGGHVVSIVKESLDLRNRVIHAEPDLQVSDTDVDTARWVTFAVPYYCCLRASERYPVAFPGWISKTASAQGGSDGA